MVLDFFVLNLRLHVTVIACAFTVQVTEGILYHLLPALLEHAETHVTSAGTAQKASSDVASAAICVSCVLNVPPGFIEFLLCSPWHQADLFKPGSDRKAALQQLSITNDQRREILNTALPEHLISILLDFVFLEEHEPSLPPLLVRTHGSSGVEISPSAPVDSETDALPQGTTKWPSFPVTREVRINPVDTGAPV
jgi:hypothetical protein